MLSLRAGIQLILVAGALASSVSAQGCVYAPPQKGFIPSYYNGTWYEIGRIQTPGGAFFQQSCVCTALIPHVDASLNYNGTVNNSCRIKSPSGEGFNLVSNLYDMRLPGQWLQVFPFPFAPSVNYTILEHGVDAATGVEYSVEYDCGESLFGVNYCIHVLARQPTISTALKEQLIRKAESYGINTQSLPFVATLQEGCW
jgi:apolipoprotein D and lipocalin family protein